MGRRRDPRQLHSVELYCTPDELTWLLSEADRTGRTPGEHLGRMVNRACRDALRRQATAERLRRQHAAV